MVVAKIEAVKLSDTLPKAAGLALQRELTAWQARCPERLTDEASLRYLYACILEEFAMTCPHPYRTMLGAMAMHGFAFECRLCKACVVQD